MLTQHLCLSFIRQQTRMCASSMDRSDITDFLIWLMSSKKWLVGVFWTPGDINYIQANTELFKLCALTVLIYRVTERRKKRCLWTQLNRAL